MACYYADAFYSSEESFNYVFNQDSDENAINDISEFIKESDCEPGCELESITLYRVDGFGFSDSTDVVIANFVDQGNGILEYTSPDND